MNVAGTVELRCTTDQDPTSANIYCLVSSDLNDDMLISYKDLVSLQRIHPGFPHVRVHNNNAVHHEALPTTVRDLTAEILSEYEDVLSDELNPVPMQTGTDMHINLIDNVKPFKTLLARRVPLRYETEANKTIQDLINKKVIVPVSETTDWCSPAFFVPKGDGVRVRLVTDYTRLNDFVKRPVHPFPSTRDIIQSIPHGCKWFAKLDAVHGYFQLALDEESSFITTFLLPQGKFRYLRAPMGLNASSDEWCCHSDRIITGLPWTKKIVDDTLIWAEDLATLKSRIQTVLNRCRELNVTISRKNLRLVLPSSSQGTLFQIRVFVQMMKNIKQ